jgi:hypothetical protein
LPVCCLSPALGVDVHSSQLSSQKGFEGTWFGLVGGSFFKSSFSSYTITFRAGNCSPRQESIKEDRYKISFQMFCFPKLPQLVFWSEARMC